MKYPPDFGERWVKWIESFCRLLKNFRRNEKLRRIRRKARQTIKRGRAGFPPTRRAQSARLSGNSFAPDSETFCKTCDPKFLKMSQKALIFAPHPDDEAMSGGLALRLMRECGFAVKDVAVTLGSNKARRPGRRAELKECCKRLSWELEICGGGEGFDGIVPASAEPSRGNPPRKKSPE